MPDKVGHAGKWKPLGGGEYVYRSRGARGSITFLLHIGYRALAVYGSHYPMGP
jgi:hypothetical protein